MISYFFVFVTSEREIDDCILIQFWQNEHDPHRLVVISPTLFETSRLKIPLSNDDRQKLNAFILNRNANILKL